MPRMEKVRLVGIRYDSMRKQYGDTTLDFMNGTEPAHTLLTLMNGGGKGLLLQMMFQVLIPLSKWGAKSENRIEALFYNERKQFQPYTFHVAVEWRLDTDPVKWLTTGIAVSAREKASATETEHETAEPRFFLYTLEQIKPGRYELEDLPLYDAEGRTARSIDELKEDLTARRSDFTIYTHTQTKDYFELLQSYDIDRKEWETLRDINRQEGGVEAYFRKGLDNHTLFHDLIIPEIGRHMTGMDEEGHPGTLLDIFRHNAAIAQHLPKLLKREEAYRELLSGIEPVLLCLEQGVGYEAEDRDHQRRGAWLRQAMKEWLGEQGKEELQWRDELERAEEEARELRWRQDNLEYAVKHREVAALEQELEENRQRLMCSEAAVEDSREQERYAQAALHWNEWSLAQRKAEGYRQELELLRNADEHREVKASLDQAEVRLREEWQTVSAGWSETLAGYGKRMRRMEAERALAEREQQTLQAVLQEKHRTLGSVTGQLQVLNAEKMDMQRAFGRLVNEAPDKLIEQLEKQREDALERRKQKERERAEADREREAWQSRAAELQERSRQAKENAVQMGEALRERQAQEREHEARLAAFLKLEPSPGAAGEPPAASWFAAAHRGLGQELERLNQELVRRQQQLWTHQLDSSLAGQAYWIPNQELKKLKEELESQGVSGYYGSEFLASLPVEERAGLLAAYPLLPYGLVLLDGEWKKRDAKRLAQLLLRAPVPVYLRSRMREEEGNGGDRLTASEGLFELPDGAQLPLGEGMELAANAERWAHWKKELLARNEELLQTIEVLRERLEQGGLLERRMQLLASGDDSATLGRKLEQLARLLLEFEGQSKEAHDSKARTMQLIGEHEAELEALRTKLDDHAAKLAKLDAWIRRLEQGHSWQQQKAGLEQDVADRKRELEDWSARGKAASDDVLTWNQAFVSWSLEQKRLLGQLKRFVAEADFAFALSGVRQDEDTADGEALSSAEGLFAPGSGRLELLIVEVEALSASFEENNRKIGELNIHIGYAMTETGQKEIELDRLLPAWRQEPFPFKPLEVVRRELVGVVQQREEAVRRRDGDKSLQDRLAGRLEGEGRSLSKLERDLRDKHGKAAEAWAAEDLNAKRAELELRSDRNRSHLAECRRLLAGLEQSMRLLDTQLRVLASQRLSAEAVFDLPSEVRQAVRVDPANAVERWVNQARRLEDAKRKLDGEVAEQRNRFLQMIRDRRDWDADLSGSLQMMLAGIRWEEYSYAGALMESIRDHAGHEIEALAADKNKAEQARDLWTDRACYRVISMLKSLKQMESRMSFVNSGGHRYPLVRLDLRGRELPEKPEEIRLLLQDYFVRAIEDLSGLYADIAEAPEEELLKRMSDSQIVLIALKNRYPTLFVYKPQTTNVFLHESPKKNHYTEWETLNKGSVTEAKGSGGQLLAARTIVMMMLMTHKRQIRQTKSWSVLVLDNPFGQAVSPHILDPIFAIAENLRFQWIVLAPPELIKLDVSRRFPVFWELELQRHTQGEAVVERLQHGGRAFDGQSDLFTFF